MIDKNHILDLLEEATENKGLFVVDVTISNSNKIAITLDGDHGVSINQIVEVSKFIEGSFDREVEDFELYVSSYGIDHPIVLLRQYQKYIDKPVEFQLNDESVVRGILVSADESKAVLLEEVIKKNRKSKKMLTGEPIEVDMKNIKLAKGIIVF